MAPSLCHVTKQMSECPSALLTSSFFHFSFPFVGSRRLVNCTPQAMDYHLFLFAHLFPPISLPASYSFTPLPLRFASDSYHLGCIVLRNMYLIMHAFLIWKYTVLLRISVSYFFQPTLWWTCPCPSVSTQAAHSLFCTALHGVYSPCAAWRGFQNASKFPSPPMALSGPSSDTALMDPGEVFFGRAYRVHFNLTKFRQVVLQTACFRWYSQQQCLSPNSTLCGLLWLSDFEAISSLSFFYFHSSASFHAVFCFNCPALLCLPALTFSQSPSLETFPRDSTQSWFLYFLYQGTDWPPCLSVLPSSTMIGSLGHYPIWHNSGM